MYEPILLTDEQMREFIVNGYLVFEPTVPLKDALFKALDDPCGHVGSFALNALHRIGSPSASRAAKYWLRKPASPVEGPSSQLTSVSTARRRTPARTV